MMFDFSIFKNQVSSVRNQIDKLANQVKEKRMEIDRLRKSPPPKADVISHLNSLVDKLASDYDAAFRFTIDRISSHPMDPLRPHGLGIISAVRPNATTTCHSIEVAMLAFFSDEIKGAIRKRIDAMQWPANAGPRIAERPALIEKAERELAELENGLVELQRQATEVGVLI